MKIRHLPLVVVAALVGACGGSDEPAAPKPAAEDRSAPAPARSAAPVDRLVARLQSADGLDVSGVVVLTASGGMIHLGAAIDELPGPAHAIHVHENGDCSAPDFSSAGGHFNPAGTRHAGPDAPAGERHAGDFGNFDVSDAGQGKFSISVASDLALSAFDGKAVIVHAGRDDLSSQPSGAAGERIACGVLGRDLTE